MAVENDLESIAFPTLTDAQVAELARSAAAGTRHFKDGETLISACQLDFSFFIVLSGHVEILEYSGDEPRTVRVHGPGEFTGDISHLTGTRSIVGAIARGETEVYEILGEKLRQALNESPQISDIVLQAFIARRELLRLSPDYTGLRVIGSRYSPDTARIRDFLARNHVLFTWTDLESDPEIDEFLKQFGITQDDTPVVACSHRLLLRNPSNRELADIVGIHRPLDQEVYDLVIVGAGPAGLAAAVYGASEGLRTVMLERTAPGGQAGSSMRIENYLGFPTGLTGSELSGRAILQAEKFGAKLSVPSSVIRLEFEKSYSILHLDDNEAITSKCLLIATGADYRRLDVEGCVPFEGAGVYYAATPNEARLCQGSEVIVVGGGNSAGQAAVFLAASVRKVYVIIRGDDLYKNMSSYLAHRLESTPSIDILYNTNIRKMSGDGHLRCVDIVNNKTDEAGSIETLAVFSFIGAVPRTDWLPGEIETDSKGFIRTGFDPAISLQWQTRRPPFFLETTCAGVFAAGDVRSGSVKRVASAVGEGAMAVQFVHEYLKQM